MTEESRRQLRDGKEKGMDEIIVYGQMYKEREEDIGEGNVRFKVRANELKPDVL